MNRLSRWLFACCAMALPLLVVACEEKAEPAAATPSQATASASASAAPEAVKAEAKSREKKEDPLAEAAEDEATPSLPDKPTSGPDDEPAEEVQAKVEDTTKPTPAAPQAPVRRAKPVRARPGGSKNADQLPAL